MQGVDWKNHDKHINKLLDKSRVDNSDVSFLARDCSSKYSGTPPYCYPVKVIENSSTFSILMGRYYHSLSLDATIIATLIF